MALGAEIREWRRSRKMSQETFAEESTVHVNEVGRVERGETNPELETLFLIAQRMNMSLGALFTEAEKRWSGGGRAEAVRVSFLPPLTRRR